MTDPSRFADLVDRCERALSEPGQVVTVAIDGHAAAGKSSIASRLAAIFKGALVPGDDYSVMDEERRAELSPPQGVDIYYDWRRMRDEAIVPLLAARTAVYHPYDWDSNQLSRRTAMIGPAPLVVLKRLFVARPELMELIDIAVVVEADAVTRAERQRKRADASPEWLARWDEAERHYLEVVRPPAGFDVRVSGVP